ncbi:ribonuclease H family protein [Pararhizobium arenae]|uniref:ribonuclease H family protein n=1 Tax=Pararhizobium arenae TaxID=1856850 RepID=UPI00094B6D31
MCEANHARAAESAHLTTYTDGSFDPVARRGGWGFVVYRSGILVAEDRGRTRGGDSSAAELTAVAMALTWIAANTKDQVVTLFSDSIYIVRGCNEWRHGWRSNSWRRRKPGLRGRSRSIPNASIWQEIDTLLQMLPRLTIEWCKGHQDNVGNIRADALAFQGRNLASPALLSKTEGPPLAFGNPSNWSNTNDLASDT